MFRSVVLVFVLTAFGASADPLFEGDSTVEIVLTAPFDTIRDERDKAASYPGVLTFAGRDYSVKVEVRGNKRLAEETCDSPPLRIDFKKDEIKDTFFEHQDDIKLVVQCKRGSAYEGYVRTEFLIYRAMNALTDTSYRVRWASVNFVDSEDGRTRLEPAFFVERKSRVAKRLDLEKTDVATIRVDELDLEQSALVHLFQYIVANPDYSIIAAPPGDECCHNAKLLIRGNGKYIPIIYDFDSTGVVNARYAAPHESLGIRRVTQRLYRGYCQHNDAVIAARDALLAKRHAMLGVFADDPILEDGPKKRAVAFLGDSFDEIADDDKFRKETIEECRG